MRILGLYVRCRWPISITVSRSVSVSFQWFSTAVKPNFFDDPPANVTDLFQRWGYSNDEISQIFDKSPTIPKSDLNILMTKLNSLHEIGVCCSDLVKIIARCPLFFKNFCTRRFNIDFHERAQILDSVFGSRQNLLSALVHNPSLARCDIEKHLKPCIALYESVGVSRSDLPTLIRSRPTLIMRSSLNDEKLDFIRGFVVSPESRLYKYLVVTIAVSKLETIYRKVENLQEFGLSREEVMSMLGRFPCVLTMSVDKVQRTMTFVTGTMKLPEKFVFTYPQLLCMSFDKLVKPRFRLVEKLKAMGLEHKFDKKSWMRTFRMKESAFVRVFICCHEEQIAARLMDYYHQVKNFKRIGETS